MQAVRIHWQDVGMEFGLEKCALIIMKSRKWHMNDRMKLPNQEKIEHSDKRKPTDTWQYRNDTIKREEMKEKLKNNIFGER